MLEGKGRIGGCEEKNEEKRDGGVGKREGGRGEERGEEKWRIRRRSWKKKGEVGEGRSWRRRWRVTFDFENYVP